MTRRLRACSFAIVLAVACSTSGGYAATPLNLDALGCQRAVGKGGQKYKKTYLKAWQKCFDGILSGKGCDTVKRDTAIGVAGTKLLDRLAKKCTPPLFFDAPPVGIGFAQDCDLPADSIDSDEAACQTLPVASRDSLGLCLACWKKAALNELLKIVNPCNAGLLPAGADFPCGTAPVSCPTDPAGVKCQRTIAKAGIGLFLTREKTIEKCLDAVRAGKIAGPCPDAAGQAKIAKAEAKKTALVQKCLTLPAWWDVCPANCSLPIGSLADISSCLQTAAEPAADQVVCQQYPGAAADGVSCPSPSPTTTTTAPTTTTTTATTSTTNSTSATTSTTTTTTTSSTGSTGTTGTTGSTTTTTTNTTTTTIVRTCTFGSGTQVRVQGKQLSANLALTGHQDWHFSPAGPDGVRTMLIPASGTHFDPAALPAGLGILCVRGDGNSNGIVDCDGGGTSYNNTVQQDHNTSNAPGGNGGFAQDAGCDDVFVNPDASMSSASLEDGSSSHPHTGVCNSPVHIVPSGSFPAGGMQLTEHLILRLISSGSCPADSDPFDGSAGDIRITGSTTTGTSASTIFDVNNTTGNLAQSASGCGFIGTEACTGTVTGSPYTCAAIDGGNLSGGKLGAAFPALDISTVNDIIGTLTVLCQ